MKTTIKILVVLAVCAGFLFALCGYLNKEK